MAKDKKVWIWIVGILALAFLLFNILPAKSDNGLISVNLYDNSGNLMAIVNGQAGVSEMGYTLNVVNTGDQALDMAVTLTGSATAYNTFSSVPGCSAVTNGMQCLFSLSTGQTKVLTGAIINADDIAPSTLTLNAVAQGSFNYFGETQIIQQGDSSTVVIQSESVVIRGCTDSSAANYDPQATEDDGSCRYGLKVNNVENAISHLTGTFAYGDKIATPVFYGTYLERTNSGTWIFLRESDISCPGTVWVCDVGEKVGISAWGLNSDLSGGYITLVYDGGQSIDIFFPRLGQDMWAIDLYVAVDGSTYYDPQLTQLAQASP